MASEIHVLFRGALPHLKALSRAMDELGFPFKVRYAGCSMEQQHGFMPMWFRRDEIGVEFDVFEGRAAVEELAGKEVDPRFDRSGNFRWSSDDDEMLAGFCAAGALAKLVDGVVFDEQDARLLSADEAAELARQVLQDALKRRRTRRPAARPADLKRFLKALLKERSDLALVDRLLVIRPVRHILRGVVFGRSGDRYHFAIDPLVRGLCYTDDYPPSGWSGNIVGRCFESVWQPLFEPVLTEALARHVFDRIGQITTLGDLAAYRFDDRWPSTEHVTLLLLAGEQDSAMEYIRQAEERHPSSEEWALVQRSRVANIAAVCAEFHAREASAAKALKIQHIWEPSPFPVELPAAERQRRATELLFTPRPWVERRPGLFHDLPEHPGETVFAMEWLAPDNRETLIAPMTREQAEDRHRNGESYVLAACLPTGWTVLLYWRGEDRNHPSRPPDRSFSDVRLRLCSSAVVVYGSFSCTFDRESMRELWRVALAYPREFFDSTGRERMLELEQVEVESRSDRNTIWNWQLFKRDGQEKINDDRDEAKVIKNQLTDADVDRLSCPEPGFCDLDTPIAMMRSVLRSRGYGEIA
jgi:hypothetical protein